MYSTTNNHSVHSSKIIEEITQIFNISVDEAKQYVDKSFKENLTDYWKNIVYVPYLIEERTPVIVDMGGPTNNISYRYRLLD